LQNVENLDIHHVIVPMLIFIISCSFGRLLHNMGQWLFEWMPLLWHLWTGFHYLLRINKDAISTYLNPKSDSASPPQISNYCWYLLRIWFKINRM